MCSTSSLSVPVRLSPSYPMHSLLILFGFPLSLSSTPSLCFMGASSQISTCTYILNSASAWQGTQIRKLPSSSSIAPFHAPLSMANLSYELDAPCDHSSTSLYLLCLLCRNLPCFCICHLLFFRNQLRFHLFYDKHKE